MTFFKDEVFTAVNADELRPGDVVFAASNIECLKDLVKRKINISIITKILPENKTARFRSRINNTGLEVEDEYAYLVRRADDFQKKEYRQYKTVEEMITEFRGRYPSPFRSKVLTEMIWIQDKDGNFNLITGFNRVENLVEIGQTKHDLEDLYNNYTYLDGSPIGVLE